jgi:hypothetical protein
MASDYTVWPVMKNKNIVRARAYLMMVLICPVDDDDDDDEVHLYGAGLHSIECSLRIKKKGDKNSNDRTEKDKRRQLGAWQVQKQQVGCN